MISLLPSKILKLLEFVGFSGNKVCVACKKPFACTALPQLLPHNLIPPQLSCSANFLLMPLQDQVFINVGCNNLFIFPVSLYYYILACSFIISAY
jgi:hypothetical protein